MRESSTFSEFSSDSSCSRLSRQEIIFRSVPIRSPTLGAFQCPSLETNADIIGFGRQVQISVRQLGLSGYRTVFAARGITHLRASNPTSGRIPNSFCLTSIPEAKYSSQLSLTKCVMGHTFTPSREGQELLFKNPSSLSLATETRRNSILTPGHSYRLDSMSFSLAKTISSREMTP